MGQCNINFWMRKNTYFYAFEEGRGILGEGCWEDDSEALKFILDLQFIQRGSLTALFTIKWDCLYNKNAYIKGKGLHQVGSLMQNR